MPNDSNLYIYGGLEGNLGDLSPKEFIFENKSVHGYWLSNEIKKGGFLKLITWIRNVSNNI